MTLLAVTRNDVADYVSALCIVFGILIMLNILIRWIPRMPFYSRWFRALLDFVTDTTDPYLGFFRRLMPSLGTGGVALDFSPIVALAVLFLARALAVALIAG
jgi:YggT family protein